MSDLILSMTSLSSNAFHTFEGDYALYKMYSIYDVMLKDISL